MTPSSEVAAQPPPPRTLVLGDRYDVGARLGEGGMGVVYAARDRMLRRTVAVKIFRDGAEGIERTASETTLLAGLNHPSLVTLFDAHIGEGSPQYLVMEFVDGPTLRQRLEAGALPAHTVAHLAQDLGDALHLVHSAGIVHRDIKPSNILLRSSTVPGEDVRAKLADFGIAHLLDSTRVTVPGTVVGSAAYLSPEQVTGAAPSTASDIYSLGLVLLEALTGHRAFPQTSTHEAAIARLTQEPFIPSVVGRAWSGLLAAMTDRDPGRRPTAFEVVTRVARMAGQRVAYGEQRDAAPTATSAVDSGGSGLREPAGPAISRTRIAPAAPPSPPTRVPVTVPLHASAALADDAGPAPERPRWRGRVIAGAAAAAVVIAGLVGVGIAVSAGGGGEQAADPPALPTLDAPLDAHFQQLLDAVTP